MVSHEGEVVADEDAAPEGDANRERPVVGVPQTDDVAVVPVCAPQGHGPEVAHPVMSSGVVFLDDFVAVVVEREAHHFHELVVSQRHMSFGRLRRRHLAELVVSKRFPSSV